MVLLTLGVAGCSEGEPDAPVPFGPPGTWAALGTPEGPVLNLTLASPSELYVAAGAAGLFHLDVSEPGRAFEPLGLANDVAEPSVGVEDVDVRGDVLLAVSTASLDLGEGPIPAGVFRSEDRGRTWARSDAGMAGPAFPASPAFRVARSPADPDVVVTGHGPAFRSADGGRTWELAYPDQLGTTSLFFGVVWHPTRPDEVWAFGETNRFQPYLLRSTDGGREWTLYSGLSELLVYRDNAFGAMAFAPDGPATVWLGGQGAVFVSAEGGLDWIRPEPLEALFYADARFDPCRGLAPHPERPGVLFASCGPAVFLAEGGAVHRLPSPNDGVVSALRYDPSADALYLGAADGVFRLAAPLRAPREPYDPAGWTASASSPRVSF